MPETPKRAARPRRSRRCRGPSWMAPPDARPKNRHLARDENPHPVGSSFCTTSYMILTAWQLACLRIIRNATGLYSTMPSKAISQPSNHAKAPGAHAIPDTLTTRCSSNASVASTLARRPARPRRYRVCAAPSQAVAQPQAADSAILGRYLVQARPDGNNFTWERPGFRAHARVVCFQTTSIK